MCHAFMYHDDEADILHFKNRQDQGKFMGNSLSCDKDWRRPQDKATMITTEQTTTILILLLKAIKSRDIM